MGSDQETDPQSSDTKLDVERRRKTGRSSLEGVERQRIEGEMSPKWSP